MKKFFLQLLGVLIVLAIVGYVAWGFVEDYRVDNDPANMRIVKNVEVWANFERTTYYNIGLKKDGSMRYYEANKAIAKKLKEGIRADVELNIETDRIVRIIQLYDDPFLR